MFVHWCKALNLLWYNKGKLQHVLTSLVFICNHKKMEGQKTNKNILIADVKIHLRLFRTFFQATIINAQNDSSYDKDTFTIANKVYRHIIFPCSKLDMCHKRLQNIWNFFWKSSQTRVSQSSYLKRFLLCCWCCYPLETNKFPIYIFHSNTSVTS